MGLPYIILTEEDMVKNIKHTSSDKPHGYRSWKEFWMTKTGQTWPKLCRIFGCTGNAFAGGHVFVKGYEESFIIPLCGSCNSAQNTDIMPVNVRTAAAVIDKDENQATFSDYEREQLEIYLYRYLNVFFS